MANGNGQNNQIPFLSSKPQDVRATIQTGRQRISTDKATGKKQYGPTVWGPIQDAHSHPISRERWLQGTRFDPKVPLNPNVEMKRERLSPEAAAAEKRRRAQRMRIFAGRSPVPAN